MSTPLAPLRVLLLAAAAALIVLGAGASLASANVNLSYTDRYFSPNGDGQEDTLGADYYVDDSSTVSIKVRNAGGGVIKTIEPGRFVPANTWQHFNWDGTNNSGGTVGNAAYTFTVHADGGAGKVFDGTGQMGVESRNPGTITKPTTGATIQGTAVRGAFTKRTTSPMPDVTAVTFYGTNCFGYPYFCQLGDTQFAPSIDGFATDFDSNALVNGANTIWADVAYNDPFTQPHVYTTSTPVTVANPVQITLQSGDQYFSPNGDGYDESVTGSYFISANSKVTVKIRTTGGTLVRTIQTDIQQSIGGYSFTWDGLNTSNAPAADGQYTATITAVDAGNKTATKTLRYGIDRSTPAVVATPAPNATLTGNFHLGIAPRAGLAVTQVDYYGPTRFTCCNYISSGLTAGLPGDWGIDIDSTDLYDGAAALTAWVYYTDPYGAAHGYPTSVNVTVDNAIQVQNASGRVDFSPNADGQEDTAGASYYVTRDATVDVNILSADGTVVRHLLDDESQSLWSGFTWDGMDDAGHPVADGTYSWQLRATGGGHFATASGQFGVDKRTPGTLVTPSEGATLSGDSGDFAFAPTAGVQVDSASFGLDGCPYYGCWPGTEGGDGVFRASDVDTSAFSEGAHVAAAYVGYTDRFGTAHTWTTPYTNVTTTHAVTPIKIQGVSSSTAFTPDGDGNEDTVSGSYSLSRDGTVTVRIENASGGVVRTLVNNQAQSAGYQPLDWDGLNAPGGSRVSDGTYTVRISARDSDGNTDAKSFQWQVVTVKIGTLALPGAGDTLNGVANFSYTPGSGPDVTEVDFCFDSPYYWNCVHTTTPTADGLFRNSIETRDQSDGPRTIYAVAYWADAFGNTHYDTISRDVTIDNAAPSVDLTADPNQGAAPLATTLHLNSTSPTGGTLHYEVHYGEPDDAPVTSGNAASPATLNFPHTYASAGTYTPYVLITDGAGHTVRRSESVTVTGAANHAPTATLTVADDSLTIGGAAASATVAGTDADGDALTYTVDWGDGSAAGSSDHGPLPHSGAITHTYTHAGSYLVSLEVGDGTQSTFDRHRVYVSLGGPLHADAGDDIVIPLGQDANLSGAASTPAGIETYGWSFGDGTNGSGKDVSHHYDHAGTFHATLTVGASGQTPSTDTVDVTVIQPQPNTGLDVTVQDSDGTVAGADVLVIDADGTRFSAQDPTGPDGKAHIDGLADGAYTVYAYAPGHKPGAASATLVNHVGNATVALEKGDVVAGNMESHRMTLQEIEDAGIDPNDPDNQHVYQFEIHLAFRDDPGVPTFDAAVNDAGQIFVRGGGGGGGGYTACTGCGFGVGGGYTAYPTVHYVEGLPLIQYMVISGRAKFLKEFFSVSLVIQNAAGTGFDLTDGQATLTLPDGLSLAPTSDPQAPTVDMADIAGGQAGKATWIVRGDDEGEYKPEADYTGVLEPFHRGVSFHGILADPLKVWGGSALKMRVVADDAAQAGRPYHVKIALENVSPIDVYNPAIELFPTAGQNFIFQPREELEQGTDVLHPGQTFTTRDYILVPTITGTLDLSHSFIRRTGGDVDLDHDPIESMSSVRPVPNFTATALDHKVLLDWDPVAGATSYAVYRTTSITTEFPDTAVPVTQVGGDPTKVTVDNVDPSDPPRFYAVSALVNGHPVMASRMIQVGSGTQAPAPTTTLTATPVCGSPIRLDMQYADPNARVDGYRVAFDGGAWETHSLPLGSTSASQNITVPAAGVNVSVQAHDELGQYGPEATKKLGQCGPPTIGIRDTTVVEGDSGTQDAVFNATLASASDTPVTVTVNTGDSSAKQPGDYTAVVNRVITFAPGETVVPVRVPIAGDTASEPQETFTVKLSKQSKGAVLGDTSAIGTIVDQDPIPALSVDDTSVVEGGTGASNVLRFHVKLSSQPADGNPVVVTYATANGSALSTSDYTAKSGTLTFVNGGSLDQIVDVPVTGDTTSEPNETLKLSLSSSSKPLTLTDNSAMGTIVTDDGTAAAVKPQLYVDDLMFLEGDSTHTANFHVRLSQALATNVTVKFSTTDSTAKSGSDFVGLPTTNVVTIPAGQTQVSVPVTINGDTYNEGAETFSAKLAGATSTVTLGDAAAKATILDEEGTAQVYVGNATAPEGSAATPGSVTFPVTFVGSLPPGQNAVVTWKTKDGTALATSDYVAVTAGTLTFAPGGPTTQNATVTFKGDAVAEAAETFSVTLSTVGAFTADTTGAGTISNDD